MENFLQNKKLCFAVLVAIMVLFTVCSFNSSKSKAVEIAKSCTFYNSKIKLGTLVKNFFGSPKWESGETENGTTVVNISGKCNVGEKKVKALIQYTVDVKKGTIQFNALEFNDVPQNLFTYTNLLTAMYEASGEKLNFDLDDSDFDF